VLHHIIIAPELTVDLKPGTAMAHAGMRMPLCQLVRQATQTKCIHMAGISQ
jgi:hypothetical protein